MMKGLMFHQEQQQQDQENMSNLTSSASADQASASSVQYFAAQPHELPPPPPPKKKRNQPGNPDPDAEVIALSPKTLMATNRFVCEVCNKGFQRDQNLQLHRRGHNLPWKLKQRSSKDVIRKKVYVCPEVSCVHHEACRALGDLTGIKKHFCRKHGEKKWKCEKCSKRYAVQSDWKAHSKTCGTREYRCDCGTLFSRRDSFITHRAFCDALAEESARAISGGTGTGTGISNHPLISSNNSTSNSNMSSPHQQLQLLHHQFSSAPAFPISSLLEPKKEQQLPLSNSPHFHLRPELPPWLAAPPPPPPPPPSMHHHYHHLSCSSPSSSHQDHHQFMTHIHDHQTGHLMSSPSSNPSLAGPTTNLQAVVPSPSSAGGGAHFNNLSSSSSGMIPSPHMSATALLQKAAQMGATMSSSSSRSELQPPTSANSASLNNMIRPHHLHHQTTHVPSTTTTSSPTTFALNLSSSSGDHQDHQNHLAQAITGNGTGDSDHHGLFLHGLPSFGNHMTFEDHAHAFLGGTTGVLSSNRLESDEGGTTRDFLGLRPLSHTDILSMAAGLGNCVNTSRDQSQKQQWRQG